jgi:hypothetical protein
MLCDALVKAFNIVGNYIFRSDFPGGSQTIFNWALNNLDFTDQSNNAYGSQRG